MSTTVTYKGSTLTTVENQTRTLNTSGKWMEGDITLVDVTSSGTAAISVVDTTDTAGGTIRTITARDISDTTAVASDVASGKYFYTAAGVKTQGTASGGGSALATETGTFTGSGGNTAQLACADFAPIAVYVCTDEIPEDPSLRGIISFTIVKDSSLYVTADSSTSQAVEYLLYSMYNFTDYNAADTENPHATYSNGVLTLDTVYNSGTARFASGVTYYYTLIGVTGGD